MCSIYETRFNTGSLTTAFSLTIFDRTLFLLKSDFLSNFRSEDFPTFYRNHKNHALS
jgi:hypothetical protein